MLARSPDFNHSCFELSNFCFEHISATLIVGSLRIRPRPASFRPAYLATGDRFQNFHSLVFVIDKSDSLETSVLSDDAHSDIEDVG